MDSSIRGPAPRSVEPQSWTSCEQRMVCVGVHETFAGPAELGGLISFVVQDILRDLVEREIGGKSDGVVLGFRRRAACA